MYHKIKYILIAFVILSFYNCVNDKQIKETTQKAEKPIQTKKIAPKDTQKVEKSFVIHDKELFKELVKTNLLFYAPELENIPKNDLVTLDFEENRIKILVDTLSENEKMLRENRLNELIFVAGYGRYFAEKYDILDYKILEILFENSVNVYLNSTIYIYYQEKPMKFIDKYLISKAKKNKIIQFRLNQILLYTPDWLIKYGSELIEKYNLNGKDRLSIEKAMELAKNPEELKAVVGTLEGLRFYEKRHKQLKQYATPKQVGTKATFSIIDRKLFDYAMKICFLRGMPEGGFRVGEKPKIHTAKGIELDEQNMKIKVTMEQENSEKQRTSEVMLNEFVFFQSISAIDFFLQNDNIINQQIIKSLYKLRGIAIGREYRQTLTNMILFSYYDKNPWAYIDNFLIIENLRGEDMLSYGPFGAHSDMLYHREDWFVKYGNKIIDTYNLEDREKKIILDTIEDAKKNK